MSRFGAPILPPVARVERIEVLDILRGFALLGILMVHFTGHATGRFPHLDETVARGLELFAEESFYPIFSFLFGLGFALQLSRTRERGSSVVLLYVRRMLVLLLIGTAHLVLLSDGDILVQYSLLGLMLIPFHRVPTWLLLVGIVGMFVLQLAETPLRDAVAEWRRGLSESPQAAESVEQARSDELAVVWADRGRPSLAAPSYLEDVRRRQLYYVETLAKHMNPKHLPFNDVLLFLLVGFYAGRRRWFQIAPLHRPILARVAVAAVAVAIVGVIVQEWTDIDSTIAGALVFRMTNLGVSVFYVSVITFIVSAADRTPWFLTLFAPVGMMALTNYLMQSLIMPLPFLPYTLDVHEPTTSEWAFWSLAFFFLVQVPISHWWLRHFRFGPVEWLWRSLSYASLQPMRRSDRS